MFERGILTEVQLLLLTIENNSNSPSILLQCRSTTRATTTTRRRTRAVRRLRRALTNATPKIPGTVPKNSWKSLNLWWCKKSSSGYFGHHFCAYFEGFQKYCQDFHGVCSVFHQIKTFGLWCSIKSPLSLWHNRWQQTTPFQRNSVARSIHAAKHFAKRFAKNEAYILLSLNFA